MIEKKKTIFEAKSYYPDNFIVILIRENALKENPLSKDQIYDMGILNGQIPLGLLRKE